MSFLDTMHEAQGWNGGSDLNFVDKIFPFARTPHPLVCEQLDHGPKFEWGLRLEAGEGSAFEFYSPINEFLSQHYTMRALRTWENIRNSFPMTCWELGNGYYVSGNCTDKYMTCTSPVGNYYITLLWHDKAHDRKGCDGTNRLRKFILKLAEMDDAPPVVFFKVAGIELLGDAAPIYIQAIDMDLTDGFSTEHLCKIYKRKLGAYESVSVDPYTGCRNWVAGCYKPLYPMDVPEEYQIPGLTDAF
jgi:hypothetical protein